MTRLAKRTHERIRQDLETMSKDPVTINIANPSRQDIERAQRNLNAGLQLRQHYPSRLPI
jgi:hypothetical protein